LVASGPECALTLRSRRPSTAWHLGREALAGIMHLAAQAPIRGGRLSSNVRAHAKPKLGSPRFLRVIAQLSLARTAFSLAPESHAARTAGALRGHLDQSSRKAGASASREPSALEGWRYRFRFPAALPRLGPAARPLAGGESSALGAESSAGSPPRPLAVATAFVVGSQGLGLSPCEENNAT